jgi:L,D-transpeptidase ErfK/SrfK
MQTNIKKKSIVLSYRKLESLLPLLIGLFGIGIVSPAIASDSPPSDPAPATISPAELPAPAVAPQVGPLPPENSSASLPESLLPLDSLSGSKTERFCLESALGLSPASDRTLTMAVPLLPATLIGEHERKKALGNGGKQGICDLLSLPESAPLPAREEPLSLVLKLRAKQVTLYRGTEKVVSYPVAIGRPGWETPRGKFQVFDMVKNPVWEHPWTGKLVMPGRNNPLGDRWISFHTKGKNVIGFHGTTHENLIGQAVSHGCVRMKNQDIRALFEKVKVGTPVIVEP